MSTASVSSAIRKAGYKTFADALVESGYADILDGGPFTLFAPTDAAFEMFSDTALENLLHGDSKRLRDVMGYHFVAGRVKSGRLQGKRYRAVMYGGADLIIDGKHKGLRVNGATVTQPDINAGGSIVHGIDGVLWPQMQAAAAP